MDLPGQMVLFKRVVESGSFSAAARTLNQSPSAISRQIAQLEDRVGVRLLTRSQQGIALTEEGEQFHERCRIVARDIAETEELVAGFGGAPRGTLRVVATVAFGKAQVLPVLADFMADHPDLRISLELSDRPVDLNTESIDVAVRFTEQLEDPNVIARKLAPNRRVVCAAPSYVARHGAPLTEGDLAGHNCLRLSTATRWNRWFGGAEVDGTLEANSADAVYHAVLAGIGIARLSTYLVGPDIRSGRLVRLLPDYVHEESSIVAIYADRRHLAPRTRAFISFLSERFGGEPPWERQDTRAPHCPKV